MKKIAGPSILLMICLILINCEPSVIFKEAAPPGIDPIETIPEIFQGIYYCQSDSSRIHIEYDVIFNESYFEFVTTLDKIKETENCSIVAGGLYLPGRQECIPFQYISEDSIKAKIYEIDTLFGANDHDIMKSYKGRLFINIKDEEQGYYCFMLTPNPDGTLLWEIIDLPEETVEIDDLVGDFEIRKLEDDITQYIINPTLREFDELLQIKLTQECDLLIPLNLEY